MKQQTVSVAETTGDKATVIFEGVEQLNGNACPVFLLVGGDPASRAALRAFIDEARRLEYPGQVIEQAERDLTDFGAWAVEVGQRVRLKRFERSAAKVKVDTEEEGTYDEGDGKPIDHGKPGAEEGAQPAPKAPVPAQAKVGGGRSPRRGGGKSQPKSARRGK